MTPQEELKLALAELAAANAEVAAAEADLAAIKAGKKIRPKKPALRPKRVIRPIHRNKLLHSGCYDGGAAPVSTRIRIDMTPVITKEIDPTDRPNNYEYVGRECLYAHDVAEGRTDSDSWMRCKCASCGEYK